MRIRWADSAVGSAARFVDDQAGMHAINAAVLALADDPAPPGAFVRGDYRRLHAGEYRVLYRVDGDVITIERVDRVVS